MNRVPTILNRLPPNDIDQNFGNGCYGPPRIRPA